MQAQVFGDRNEFGKSVFVITNVTGDEISSINQVCYQCFHITINNHRRSWSEIKNDTFGVSHIRWNSQLTDVFLNGFYYSFQNTTLSSLFSDFKEEILSSSVFLYVMFQSILNQLKYFIAIDWLYRQSWFHIYFVTIEVFIQLFYMKLAVKFDFICFIKYYLPFSR